MSGNAGRTVSARDAGGPDQNGGEGVQEMIRGKHQNRIAVT